MTNTVGTMKSKRVPTQNIIAPTATDTESAVPTSVSPAISTIGIPARIPGMMNPRQNVPTSVCQRANQPESASTITIFAASDGWNCPIIGTLIQRFEPYCGSAIPGT